MQLPDVTLGEMFALLGEKDVKIFQLEKRIQLMEKGEQEVKATAKPAPKFSEAPAPKDPFKKGK